MLFKLILKICSKNAFRYKINLQFSRLFASKYLPAKIYSFLSDCFRLSFSEEVLVLASLPLLVLRKDLVGRYLFVNKTLNSVI